MIFFAIWHWSENQVVPHQIHNKNNWADLMTIKIQTQILGAFLHFQLHRPEDNGFYLMFFLLNTWNKMCSTQAHNIFTFYSMA